MDYVIVDVLDFEIVEVPHDVCVVVENVHMYTQLLISALVLAMHLIDSLQ